VETPPRPGAADAARLDEQIDELWPSYVNLLKQVIAVPTLAGKEGPAQELLARSAKQAGLDVELWEIDPAALSTHADFATADHSLEPRPNVTAILPGTGGGSSIAISGHIDVVPVGPPRLWTEDPWGGRVEGDRLYGRGTLDMKGGLVAGLLAAHAIARASLPHRGDIVFESVIEEECTGNGTLAARQHGPAVDAALIPEVSGEDVQIANPGVVWFEVTLIGKPAYVGLAGASVNAIDLAADLVTHLRSLPPRLNAAFSHPAYDAHPNPLTLNAGTIRGGDWPSNVPLECAVGFRLAFPLGWTVEQARATVTEAITEFAASRPWLIEQPPVIRWHGFQAHGFAIDPDAPLVALLRSAVREVSGEPARVSAMFGTADARYFADEGIPAAYYGPAGGGMHAPDEWVSLTSVNRVAKVLARTALAWTA
jgi:acetylornithine deacetylase